MTDDASSTPLEMHDDLVRALEDVYNWYGDVLPARLTSTAFPRFITRSRQIMDYVKEDLPLKFDMKSMTAFTDGVSVTIPVIFLLPEFYEMYNIPEEHHAAAATLLINGCQGHEALHCKVTPFSVVDFAAMDTTGEASTLIAQYKGFKDCLNVVEDVFIEAHGRHFYRGVAGFVDGKNEILLGPFGLAGVIEQIEEKGTEYTPEDILGLVAFNKNRVTRYHPDLVDRVGPMLDITDEANNAHLSPAMRLDISKRLFWAIYDATGGEEGAEGSEFMKSPLPAEGEGDASGLNEMDRDQLLKELAEALGKAMAESGMTEEDLEEMFERIDAELADARADAEMEKAATDTVPDEKPREATRDKVHQSADWLEALAKPVIKDVLEIPAAYNDTAKPSSEWQRLGQHLRYLREEKYVPGKATDTGGRIQKRLISAIATTGKILARTNRESVVRGKPEVIILVDSSGSMRGHRGIPGDSSLFVSTVNAALGMYEALMRATISVSVFAHTSTGGSPDAPLVTSVAAFRMPVFGSHAVSNGNYIERFNRLIRVRCLENYDGIAIETVGSQFTTTPGSKVLVVLSDGAPSARGYGGRQGYAHTKNAAAELRRQGRHVIAVSLVESVVGTNNEIYGEDYNLTAFGDNLVPSLQALAGRLAIPAS